MDSQETEPQDFGWARVVWEDATQIVAARLLLERGEFQTASILLSCAMFQANAVTPEGVKTRGLFLRAPDDAMYTTLLNDRATRSPLLNAIHEVGRLQDRVFRCSLVHPDHPMPGRQLVPEEQGLGGAGPNQGLMAKRNNREIVWAGITFATEGERRIAEVLDKQGAMYFANCMARLGSATSRENREPDFLICYKGKWGILEIDGGSHTGRKDQDDKRDRLFKRYGIKVVEHFPADECYHSPQKVVGEFLDLLVRNG